jgi:hypothetical protein
MGAVDEAACVGAACRRRREGLKPMAWEERDGRRYYYRKVWKDGRCFSVYEGGGLAGQMSAERAEAERAQARRVTLSARAELAAFDKLDALIDAEWLTVKAAADAALEAAGYRRHERQWRLKRYAEG